MIAEAIASLPGITATVISLALILICGFAMTRLTKLLRLPTVTAYIVTGILLGPYVFRVIPSDFVAGMDFFPDIALPFIAFSIGEYFSFSDIRKTGKKTLAVVLFECIITSVAVFAACRFLLALPVSFSLILAALVAVKSPGTTIMTIRQTESKGDFVNTLLQIIVIDDIIGLLIFAVAVAVASPLQNGRPADFVGVLTPLLLNIASIAIGILFGFLVKALLPPTRTVDNRLIIAVALLLTLSGICSLMGVSPLLACMAMGTVYFNLTKDQKLFRQLSYFSPPILLLFFVRSGLNFDLSMLGASSASICAFPLIAVALVYFAVRFAGQYLGVFLGCKAVGKPKKTQRFLGFTLLPQASVAIGLAALAAREFGGEAGRAIETVIISASILNELIGPAMTKMALVLSGATASLEELSAVPETAEDGTKLSDVEILIRRIRDIQEKLPDPSLPSPEEQAFNEAAEEHYAAGIASRRRGRRR